MLNLKHAFILTLGVSISFYMFYRINNEDLKVRKSNVKRAVENAEITIAQELHNIHVLMASLNFLIKKTPLSKENFTEFTAPFIKNFHGLSAVAWAPKITSNNIQNLSQLNSNTNPEFLQSSNHDSALNMLINNSYPIKFITPNSLVKKRAAGFNLAALENISIEIMGSSNSENFSVIPFRMPSANKGGTMLAVKMVFQEEKIIGVIVAEYNMKAFIESALNPYLDAVDILIYDKSDVASQANLYSTNEIQPDSMSIKQFKHSEISIGDRVWSLYHSPKENYLNYPFLVESIYMLLCGLLLTSLTLLISYKIDHYRYDIRKKSQQRTIELDNSNHQMEILLKEIHHRVKNNLQIITSLLSLQSSTFKDQRLRGMYKTNQLRINSMAMVHEMLYQSKDISRINYISYLENLIQGLIHSIIDDKKSVILKIDAPEIFLNIDTAIPLGLLVNEIVTNSLKYAFPKNKGVIVVQFKRLGSNTYEIQIGDNGTGFQEDVIPLNSKSLGLKLIHSLARQLNGKIIRVSSKEGTYYKLQFQEIEQ